MQSQYVDWVTYYKNSVWRHRNAAIKLAKEGNIYGAKKFLDGAKKYGNAAAVKYGDETALICILEEEEKIMSVAYRNGVKWALGLAQDWLKFLEENKNKATTEFEKHNTENSLLSAYGLLVDARKWAKEVGMDVESQTNEIKAKLEPLGLKNYSLSDWI